MGAYVSDLLFQLCGFAAFLLPVGIVLVALRWFRSQLGIAGGQNRRLDYAGTSVSAAFTLVRLPDVRGAIPPGGLMGHFLPKACSLHSTVPVRM